MRGRRHPVTVVIDAMVARCQEFGKDITPTRILEYTRHNLSVADYSYDQAMSDGLEARVPARLKALGFAIADEDGTRKEYEKCTVKEFSVQVQIKRDNRDAVQRQLDADEKVEQYLKAKEEALGREVVIEEFAADVAAIYAEHGIA